MPDVSPKEQERILESLVEQGFLSPEQAQEVRDLHQNLAQAGKDSDLLEVALDRRLVTRRVVDQVSLARAQAARRHRNQASAVFWSGLAAVLVGAAGFVLQRTGLLSKPEPAPPEIRRLHPAQGGPEGDERARYESEKRRQEEMRKTRRADIEAWQSAHAAESEIRIEQERRKDAEEAARRAAEEKEREAAETARRAAAAEAARAAQRKALDDATVEFDRFVPEIENFVRFFAYAQAISEYEKYRATLAFPELTKRVDDRIAQLRILDGVHRRLKQAINERKLADDTIRYGEADEPQKKEAKISAATDDYYEITFPGGSLRMRWAYLRPLDLYELYRRMTLAPTEQVALGIFCYESELPYQASALFVAALGKDAAVKPGLDAYVAAKRGIPMPPGGFIPYQGLLVTPEERDNYERGLIKCGSLWIKPEEVAYVQKGWVRQSDGKWIPRNEAELIAKGYRKFKDKWYTAEELAVVRQKWENAWELDTQHYHIRSNTTEAWTRELGDCLEQAWLVFKEHFGGEPKAGKPMQISAFRTFEDYRNFCIEQKAEALIPAAGHTNAGKNYASGYSKSGDKELLATMIHEGAHLFYGRTWSDLSPSWYHEGMATFFEGYTWDKKKLVFHHVSPYRLSWLKPAFQKNQYLPLAELLQGDAIASIHKGARDSTLFYAEAWALYYWLNRSGNAALKAKFDDLAQRYRTRAFGDSVMKPAGALASFTQCLGDDVAALEAEWKKFILELPAPK
ncbi:MAG: hypothetical protein HZA54_05020 [Planctomycetes bacterium]|nr:hypothetical protein [Planctomycetota bacterium]